jgi:hypothetical protein
MRRVAIGAAVLAAIVAGIFSATVMSAGSAEQPPGAGDELAAGTVQTGETVPDPHGGPPWAVRIFDGDSSRRCIATGRTDGQAFGPVDASGTIHDAGDIARGSCADPKAEPLQAAVAGYADSAGTGPRSVVFGVADASVATVRVTGPDVQRTVTPDAERTFVVVGDGRPEKGAWTVDVTLSDGSTRTYSL